MKTVYVNRDSRVRREQVLAILDPEPFQVQLRQAQAVLDTARADAAVAHVALDEAREGIAMPRLQTDAEKRLAEIEIKQAQAEIDIADAQVQQDEGAVEQAKANLDRTKILAPVDGLVVDRSIVEDGKAVEAGAALFKILPDPASSAGR